MTENDNPFLGEHIRYYDLEDTFKFEGGNPVA